MEKLGFILLADDSENDRELITRALRKFRLVNEIVTVRDGAEALDFLLRRGDFKARETLHPILVLLDIKMPRVNGLEVLELIKHDPHLCHIPVVMLTSSKEGPDVDECYRLQANAYVVKPTDFEEFADAVKTLGKFWAVLNEMPNGLVLGVTSGK